MSQVKVNSITDEAGTGPPDFPRGATLAGAPISQLTEAQVGNPASTTFGLVSGQRLQQAQAASAAAPVSPTFLASITGRTASGLTFTHTFAGLGTDMIRVMIVAGCDSTSGGTAGTITAVTANGDPLYNMRATPESRSNMAVAMGYAQPNESGEVTVTWTVSTTPGAASGFAHLLSLDTVPETNQDAAAKASVHAVNQQVISTNMLVPGDGHRLFAFRSTVSSCPAMAQSVPASGWVSILDTDRLTIEYLDGPYVGAITNDAGTASTSWGNYLTIVYAPSRVGTAIILPSSFSEEFTEEFS